MEKNKFEEFFKDTFENFEAEVKPSIWSSIKTAIAGAGFGVLGKTLLNKIGLNVVIAVVSSTAAVVGTVAIVNWTSHSSDKKSSSSVNSANSTPVVNSVSSAPVASISNNGTNEVVSKEANKESIDKKDNSSVVEKTEESKAVLVRSTPLNPSKTNINGQSLKNLEIASIFANPTSGPAPLIVNFSNSGNGKNNIWKFNNAKISKTSPNTVQIFDKPGVYEVLLTSTNENGISATDKKIIEVSGSTNGEQDIPVFTPNGDGENDFYVFQSKNIVKMTADIYDKLGNLVYSYSGIGGKWNGKNYNGEDVSEGTYFYSIMGESKDGKKYTRRGSIVLAR